MRTLKWPRNNTLLLSLLCYYPPLFQVLTTSTRLHFPVLPLCFSNTYDRTNFASFSISLTSLCTFMKITITFIYFRTELEWKSQGFGCAITIMDCMPHSSFIECWSARSLLDNQGIFRQLLATVRLAEFPLYLLVCEPIDLIPSHAISSMDSQNHNKLIYYVVGS